MHHCGMSARRTYDLHAEFLSPPEVARILPSTTALSVRRWAASGRLPGAIQLPNGRWQIPWSAVVEILGFDPRDSAAGESESEDPDGQQE